MSNNAKDINIKNHTYYFLDNIINIKKFDPINTKIDEKSYYHITYVMIKKLKTL